MTYAVGRASVCGESLIGPKRLAKCLSVVSL